MGFFLGWLIVAMDDKHHRSDEEAAAFAWALAIIFGVGGYLISIAARLNYGIPIDIAYEGLKNVWML